MRLTAVARASAIARSPAEPMSDAASRATESGSTFSSVTTRSVTAYAVATVTRQSEKNANVRPKNPRGASARLCYRHSP